MLQQASSVSVAKGKKSQRLVPATAGKNELLQQVMGPSGNLRAPTYRFRDEFIVGFNVELYSDWVKESLLLWQG